MLSYKYKDFGKIKIFVRTTVCVCVAVLSIATG